MAPIPFTKNFTDHSNNTGYQFEFHCDKCGNGFRSSFQTSTLGVAAGILKAAGSLFGGGKLASAGWGADHLKDALRGPQWDSAFQAAVEEIRPRFHQCTRCGKWVCPEVCWNEGRQLCEDCAPNLQEQAAAIQAQVAVEQAQEKARKSDQTGGLDLAAEQIAACPKCRASLQLGAKFCSACGTAIGQAAKSFCSECGGPLAAGAKFCAGCGKPAK